MESLEVRLFWAVGKEKARKRVIIFYICDRISFSY